MLSFPFFLTAQEKPGKLRIEKGFLSNKYEIGDKTTPAKEVALHLKKHEPDAYYQWKSADKAGNNSLVFALVGLAGMAVGLFSDNTGVQLAGYSGAVLGFTGELICYTNSNKRRGAAIKIYNTKFGY